MLVYPECTKVST